MKRLGDILIESGFLTAAELAEALSVQKESGKRLGEVITETETGGSAKAGLESVALNDLDGHSVLISLVGELGVLLGEVHGRTDETIDIELGEVSGEDVAEVDHTIEVDLTEQLVLETTGDGDATVTIGSVASDRVEGLERTTDDGTDTPNRSDVLTDHDVAVHIRGVEAAVVDGDNATTDADKDVIPLVSSLSVRSEHAGCESDRQSECFKFHI